MSVEADRYGEWLQGRGVAFGFDRELARYSDRVALGVKNTIPPIAEWGNILLTVEMVENVRARFGPTLITSGYRSRSYNSAIYSPKQATDSEHCRNRAIDFRCLNNGTPVEWHAFLRDLRTKGAFRGGLGLYNTFVHVDTRGTNADWDYRT